MYRNKSSFNIRRAPKKSKSTKKLLSYLGILIISTYLVTVSLWPMRAINAKPSFQLADLGKPQEIIMPTQGASSVMAVGYGTLAEVNSEQPLPIASITKIVTALVVLDKKPLDAGSPGPTITLTQEDSQLYDHYYSLNGSVAPAPAGLKISQKDALTALLLPSANNYADTLATWAYGSQQNYVTAANSFLQQKNLTDTVIADASGFSPNSKSSTKELLILGQMIIDNPTLSQIVIQKTATIDGLGEIKNSNFLLDQNGVIGIKTGNTDEAKRCLLFAAKYKISDQDVTIIAAAIGQETFSDLHNNTLNILNSTRAGFTSKKIADAHQVVGSYQAPWGARSNVVTSNELTTVVWQNKEPAYQLDMQPLKAGDKDENIGSLSVTAGEVKKTTTLELANKLNGPSYMWRIIHPLTVFNFN